MNVDLPADLVVRTGKSAGLYGGVGIAADAFRYMVLRDQGARCDAVARARDALLAGIEAMHMATAIYETWRNRAIARKDLPGDGFNQTVPLFDDVGNPLPETKNNGTWRDDQDGLYADHIWEDSCSRDMYVGWALAIAHRRGKPFEMMATFRMKQNGLSFRIFMTFFGLYRMWAKRATIWKSWMPTVGVPITAPYTRILSRESMPLVSTMALMRY